MIHGFAPADRCFLTLAIGEPSGRLHHDIDHAEAFQGKFFWVPDRGQDLDRAAVHDQLVVFSLDRGRPARSMNESIL